MNFVDIEVDNALLIEGRDRRVSSSFADQETFLFLSNYSRSSSLITVNASWVRPKE